MPATSSRPALWMLCGALLFAAMAALTHALGSRCDWLVIALVRAVVMFGAAVAMARAGGVRLAFLDPPTLWMRSLAGSVSLVCNFYAMTKLPVADVLTLTNMYPLWIILLSGLALRRFPGWLDLFGVACGIVGVVLIERPDLGVGRFAAGVALIGSASTAVAMLGLHRLRDIDARAIVAHFAGVASLVAAGWLVVRGGSFAALLPPDAASWAFLAGVAISGTAGQFCLTRAYASGPPTQVSLVGLSQVAFAMILDVLIWGRSFTLLAGIGFALVLAPTAWLASRAGRRLAEVEEVEEAEAEPSPADPPAEPSPRFDRPTCEFS